MDRISELKSILGKSFDWNMAQLDCVSRMLLGLFAGKTVNLKEIATAFAGDAQPESNCKHTLVFFGTDLTLFVRLFLTLPQQRNLFLKKYCYCLQINRFQRL